MSVPVTCDVFVMPPPSRRASQALQRHLCLVTGVTVTGSEGEATNVVTDANIICTSIVEEVESSELATYSWGWPKDVDVRTAVTSAPRYTSVTSPGSK